MNKLTPAQTELVKSILESEMASLVSAINEGKATEKMDDAMRNRAYLIGRILEGKQ